MIEARLALCALALLPATAGAQRWDDREVRSIVVDTSALDLSTPAGRAELDRRIARAVNRICDGDAYCRDEAWDSTYEQVGLAIERDDRIRRLAREREMQLAACGGVECPPPAPQVAQVLPPPPPAVAFAPPAEIVQPLGYGAPPAPYRSQSRVTVIVQNFVSPPQPPVVVYTAPGPAYPGYGYAPPQPAYPSPPGHGYAPAPPAYAPAPPAYAPPPPEPPSPNWSWR